MTDESYKATIERMEAKARKDLAARHKYTFNPAGMSIIDLLRLQSIGFFAIPWDGFLISQYDEPPEPEQPEPPEPEQPKRSKARVVAFHVLHVAGWLLWNLSRGIRRISLDLGVLAFRVGGREL